MSGDWRWVTRAEVLEIHRRLILGFGGRPGLRDGGLLDSALARPRHLLAYGGDGVDAPALAASLAFGMARNHPFVDGNKRVAFTICRVFLRLNGLDFRADPDDKYRAFLRLAAGDLTEEGLAAWIRERQVGPATGTSLHGITTSPRDFATAFARLPARSSTRVTMRRALLVGTEGFRVATSYEDNAYLDPRAVVDPDVARRQHADLARTLEGLGVPVTVLPGVDGQDDGVYPNNVYAFAPGRAIIGAMKHEVRRREAERTDARRWFEEGLGYEIVDLSATGCVAELTGALIIDHARDVGYCGMTSRVDEAGCRRMHDAFALALTFRFDLASAEYHTNIVLSILAGRVAIIHPPSFADPAAAEAIAAGYGANAVELSDEEKNEFAGNCLAITPGDVLFSARAESSLRSGTRERIERAGFRIHAVDVSELEKGGGSLRCLIAEIF